MVLLLLLAGVAWLAIPGTPRNSSSLDLDRYIILPQGKLLKILGYISFHDGSVYITSISDGSVIKVGLPTDSREIFPVQQMRGSGQAHGVAFDAATGLGYATHSGSNTVDVFSPSDLSLRKQIPVADDVDGILYEPGHKLIYAMSGTPV